jgi:hypothetical protein
MGMFDFLFGRKEERRQEERQRPVSFGDGPVRLGGLPAGYGAAPAPQSENERALERYRYMLRTAPPETIEQAHAEAFERMTPEQRGYVLQALANELPAGDRDAAMRAGSDPHSLARTATRAELRSPGAMERSLGKHQGGMMGGGMGMMAGTLLGAFAMGFAGSMVAGAFFDAMGDPLAEASEAMPEELAMEEPFADADFASYDGGMEEF